MAPHPRSLNSLLSTQSLQQPVRELRTRGVSAPVVVILWVQLSSDLGATIYPMTSLLRGTKRALHSHFIQLLSGWILGWGGDFPAPSVGDQSRNYGDVSNFHVFLLE